MQRKLPKQQTKALQLYNQGYSRKQAAALLHVSEHTYAWYLRKIRQKFNIRTRKEMLDLEQALQKPSK
jgi:DNA-binding CsgD family transcriptional regulator